MHQDQKIGAALAILLIGFTGAFCFRHEPVVGPEPLTLDMAEQIDERIEHLPVRAYLEREGVSPAGKGEAARRSVSPDGPIADILESGSLVPPTHQHEEGNRIPPFAGAPEPLRIGSEMPAARSPARPRPGRSTSPSSTGPSAVGSVESQDASRHSAAEQPGGPSRRPADRESEDSRPSDDSSTISYQVRLGDTLSELAQRFLGSSRRYDELYEANRDVLSSPHALRAGMILRIPVEHRIRAAPVSKRPSEATVR